MELFDYVKNQSRTQVLSRGLFKIIIGSYNEGKPRIAVPKVKSVTPNCSADCRFSDVCS